MRYMNRPGLCMLSTAGFLCLSAGTGLAADPSSGIGDGIARFLITGSTKVEKAPPKSPDTDPRKGEKAHEQAKRLMKAIDSVLKDAAHNRGVARKLPRKDDYLVVPIWTETREDREAHVKSLLDAALGIVTDVPVVDVQKRIELRRKAIRELEETISQLREKRLTAPKDALLPGVLNDTVESIDAEIADAKKRIAGNEEDIAKAKKEVQAALKKSGIKMAPEQVDLLLDSVLSGDLVRLVASFNAARIIDQQLAKLVGANSDNLKAARKYFAMHAALFAMLVHAQNALIEKIDTQYLPKLKAIEKDIKVAQKKTRRLLKAKNRPDQKRALAANQRSQQIAARGAAMYRSYLLQQREQLAKARARAVHDLKIADNTYETVEASFQLRALMRDSKASFEAIQKLEAPIFDRIFENEALRREFESLTRRLSKPTS